MISIADKEHLAFNLRRIIDLAQDNTQHPDDGYATIARVAKLVLESLQEP